MYSSRLTSRPTVVAFLAAFALLAAGCGSDTAASDDPTATTAEATVSSTDQIPDTTSTPDTTRAPETTRAPQTSAAPETTSAPETTRVPQSSAAPETTGAPETTTITDRPEADAAVVDALTQAFLADYSSMSDDPADAECVSNLTFEGLGVDGLADAGFTAESTSLRNSNFDEEQAVVFATAAFACIDVLESIAQEVEGGDATAEQARCVAEALGEDVLFDATVAGLVTGAATPEFIDTLETAGESCGLEI